ncbi:MAG: REP-associated tyrosine transposase [Panacagrimonas sp.]
MYLFTVTLAQRDGTLLTDHAEHLGKCFRSVRQKHPFVMDACVVLPDQLHCISTLPEDNADFSLRWFLIKSAFSRDLVKGEWRRESRVRRGERGVWKRRLWEHVIRDERDFSAHVDYIHINRIKHGLAKRAIDWPPSLIHRYVRERRCSANRAAERFVLEMALG